MPELNPLSNDQIFLKKIAENTGSDYNTGDVTEINPLTIDQILLKEIAANTAGGSGEITDLKNTVGVMLNVNGSKNILPNNAASKTENNVTFTVNSDDSITVSTSGAATGNTRCEITTAVTVTRDSILSGCPSGGSGTTYVLVAYDGATYYPDLGSGIALPTGTYSIYILVYGGATISTPITFYPMLRDARISDSTYAPYAMTNRELTEKVTPKIIATAAANQTYEAQLTTLKTVWDSLSRYQKRRCVIWRDDDGWSFIYNMHAMAIGGFTAMYSAIIDSAVTTIIEDISIAQKKYIRVTTAGSTVTSEDVTSTTNTRALYLVMY